MKIHHSSKSKYGNCLICGKPILCKWYDVDERNGNTETFQEHKNGNVHYACVSGAKSLRQLNEERKQLHS